MMDRRDFEEQIVDFLYEDQDPAERAAFQDGLKAHPEFQAELHDFHRVAQIYHNHLPDLTPPPALLQQILAKAPKPKKRSSWFHFEAGAFWGPALTGALAMALTLVGLYQYKEYRDGSSPVAKHMSIASQVEPGGDLNLRDLSLAMMRQARPMPAPAWRQPRMGNGLVSFASYGNTQPMYDGGNEEIYGLEQEAHDSLAQFAHQQAIRMHALGDIRGAAEALAVLIKKYPNYSRIFEALALRIGCLFQIGELAKAEHELTWLRQNSPDLAVLVERRWKSN